MHHTHSKFVHYTVIIISQIFILAFGYGFLGAVAYYEYLAPSDSVCETMKNHPGEVTMLVALIATVLSVITATLFTLSVKEALRHRICQPISLIQLSAGVALGTGLSYSQPSTRGIDSPDVVYIWGAEALNGRMNGSEIDITGSAFATLLQEEFLASGLITEWSVKWDNEVQNDAFEVLDIGGMLSGVAAAGFTFGLPGTFNFNGAKYNISTQGVVPTIEAFSGSDGIPDANGTRLGFSGGNVTVNTGVVPGLHSGVPIPQGFSTNYSMWQQGLTANVSCQAIDSSQTQYLWNTNNSDVIYTNPAASSNNFIAGLRLWNISVNCGTNTSTAYEYVTMVDANGNGNLSGNGFLPSVVCLGPTYMNQNYTSFTIFTQGFYKYDFLKASVCEVVPLLTRVRADYSNEQISSEVISSTPFQSENAELLLFIAGVARYQSINSQGLTSSTIGDTLYSTYSSTTTEYVNNNLNDTQVYLELEDYWRGVVEFSATVRLLFLRSGFMATGSFPDNIIPNNLSSPINGTMFISTIGWTRWTKNSPTYLLATVPLTIITILTFSCALYSLLETLEEHRNHTHKAHFNVSNTIHLVMLCAAGSLKLADFGNRKGIKKNEVVKVHLEDLHSPRLST
ncbi:uncharacterized protein F5147DRAFT_805769 [Suillus discolor]|uniref:Uncharacterized protein n=1 Tax=Suillus discolor TaxID=1912936 RepID=A0A9P7F4H4_9AGAM|nr:uncharacterized protein F5147DRAFT_805769 [Suillus discolor]KAG2105532.1 hypothetical protein F5147DRAFT_805769 [Suillus discolor]